MFTPFVQQNETTARIARELGLRQAEDFRYNFGSNNCDRAAAVVAELRQKGMERADILTHGVSAADHGGWCPFVNRESFRKHLDAIAELERKGEIIVTDYDGMVSSCALKAGAWPRHGVLSLSFDDASFDQWEEALPLFAKYDARTTFFVVGTNRIDFMKQALAAGHEVGMHGLDHREAPTTGSDRDEDWFWKIDIAPQLATLREAGIPVRSYAYPNCVRTGRTDALFLSRGFSRVRGLGAPFLVSHGISPDAKGISMKTGWLERMLSSAADLGVVVRGIR